MNSNAPYKTIFFGSADFSTKILDFLIKNTSSLGLDLVGVVTRKDARVGRKGILQPNPVKTMALGASIPVFVSLKEAQKYMKTNQVDLAITAAYGLILKEEILSLPTHGFLNVHGSLLPKLRGAIPIQMAIFTQDATTGITLIKMDSGMDTGDILIQKEIPIDATDTFGTLSDKLASLAFICLREVLPVYLAGTLGLQKQDNEKATYCYIADVDEIKAVTIFSPAHRIAAAVRSLAPFEYISLFINNTQVQLIDVHPMAVAIEHTHPGDVVLVKDHGSHVYLICEGGMLELIQVKPSGKNVMKGSDFYNGYIKNKL